MTIVLEMSAAADIVGTPLDHSWPAETERRNWAAVTTMTPTLPGGVVIVVVAHGNNTHIGNVVATIAPEQFLATVQGNMQPGQEPSAIYISTCGVGIAQYAAGVRLSANNNGIWANTRIFGHASSVAGPVPSPAQTHLTWVEIF